MSKINQTLALAICLFIGFNQPVFADDDDGGVQLQIVRAFAMFDLPGDFLEIVGAGFDNGDPNPPILTLGGITLTVVSFDANNILAELPLGLPAGDYLLNVNTVNSDDDDDDDDGGGENVLYDMTIGAVGPVGAQGPQGKLGPPGADGATGATGPSGPVDNLGNHTATQDLDLATFELVGNGGSAGISIANDGDVTIGTKLAIATSVPTTSPPSLVQLYADLVAASTELRVRDEAGNVTTLSPHNFSLIGQASEPLAWSHYSENGHGKINVDMLRAMRLLESLSGERLVHIQSDNESEMEDSKQYGMSLKAQVEALLLKNRKLESELTHIKAVLGIH